MKPNFLFVMADQLRADLRKSRDFPLDVMPFLDAWAQGGVDFDRAYTANPTCMPARVSMMTGRYPQCHRVRTNHNAADVLYTQDLIDILRENGYRTALCGKNHTHRSVHDFDFSAPNGHNGLEGDRPQTQEEAALTDFLRALQSRESLTPSPGTVRAQYPYRNVTDALRFIDGLEGDAPFFAWVSFAEPHPPYQAPAPYFDLFPPQSLPALPSAQMDPALKGPRYVWTRGIWARVMQGDEQARIARARSNYLGMIRLIDDQFRRLIEGLRARGLEQRTVVVFLADHGDFAGEYGLTRKGPDLSQALTRIPMVWRGPGIAPQGLQASACVNIVDVLPTICDILDVPLPLGCQGRSLLPLLQGRQAPPHEFDVGYSESGYGGLYWTAQDGLTPEQEGATRDYTTFDTLNSWTQSGQVRMVRKGDYALQLDMMGDGYLYCLRTDPAEQRNLFGDPAHAAVQADLLRELAAAMMRACDPLPPPRSRYRLKLHPRGYWRAQFAASDPGIPGGASSSRTKSPHSPAK